MEEGDARTRLRGIVLGEDRAVDQRRDVGEAPDVEERAVAAENEGAAQDHAAVELPDDRRVEEDLLGALEVLDPVQAVQHQEHVAGPLLDQADQQVHAAQQGLDLPVRVREDALLLSPERQ